MGINFGYKKSLLLFAGILSGFFIILVITNFFAVQLYIVMPWLAKYVKILGAVYLLFLAYQIATSSPTNKGEKKRSKFGFFSGFALQYLNLKGIIFALAVNSSYIVPVTKTSLKGLPYMLVIMVIVFFSLSTWNLFGLALNKYLKKDKTRRLTNVILALLIVYSAYLLIQT